MHFRQKLLPLAMTVGVAGCAVVPIPMDDVELANYVAEKSERVVADQEPLHGPVSLYEAMARAEVQPRQTR